MIDNTTLEWEIEEARQLGCILRVKRDASGCVSFVSFGRVPALPYRRLGQPGAGWTPPIQAHARLQDILCHILGTNTCRDARENDKENPPF